MRLAIERNIYEMCPKRKPQSRMQHENLDVSGFGTTRPLRRVALSDETCDLTDEEAQEATVRACRSANPGIIILGISRTASKSHLELCMTLCCMCEFTAPRSIYRSRFRPHQLLPSPGSPQPCARASDQPSPTCRPTRSRPSR